MGGLAPHPPEGLVSVGGDSDGRMSQSMRVWFSVRINVATARGGEEEQQTRASGASAPSERVKPVWRAGVVVTRERGPACVSRTSGDRLRKAACSVVKTREFIRTTKNPLEGFKEGRGGPDPSPDRSHGRGESPGWGARGPPSTTLSQQTETVKQSERCNLGAICIFQSCCRKHLLPGFLNCLCSSYSLWGSRGTLGTGSRAVGLRGHQRSPTPPAWPGVAHEASDTPQVPYGG